jgi:hypothetical protein
MSGSSPIHEAGETTMKMEISEDVLTAIRSVVEYNYYSTSGDDTHIIVNDLPVLYAWLEELGLLSPLDTEEPV